MRLLLLVIALVTIPQPVLAVTDFIYEMEKGESAILLTDESKGDCYIARKVSDGGKTLEKVGCWDIDEQDDVIIIRWRNGVTERYGWGDFQDYQEYLKAAYYERGWLE